MEVYEVRILRDLGEKRDLTEETWYMGANTHRIGGPAHLLYSQKTGCALQEDWWLNGKVHREDGPAQIDRFEETGVVFLERWYQNDKLHREGGPALIERHKLTGEVLRQEFWRRGRRLPENPVPQPGPAPTMAL